MKKKFILLAMMLLTLMGGVKFNVLNAQEDVVAVHEDATSTITNYPIAFQTACNFSQHIYLSSDLNHGKGIIDKIAFKVFTTQSGNRSITLYLKNTSSATLSSWEIGSTQVFQATLDPHANNNGWLEFDIDDFEYDGTNILVSCYDNAGASYLNGNDATSYRGSGAGNVTIFYNSTSSFGLNEDNVPNNNGFTGSRQPAIKFFFAEPADDIIPAAPTNLVATAIDHQSISLTWDAAENALKYQVWQGENMIAEIEETEFLVEGLSDNTGYCFTVKSVRYNNTSDASSESCATTAVLPVPATPANLTATNITHNSVTLTWDAVDYAESYTVSYTGGTITVTENTYVVTGLTPETDYTFSVTANNIKGSSSAAEVSATTLEYNDPFAGKLFRIKVMNGSYAGYYLNVNSHDITEPYYWNEQNDAPTRVGVLAREESNRQIFTITDNGEGKYYLRDADGYLIKCDDKSNYKGRNTWDVDAYSTTVGTPLWFDYVDGEQFYIRDYDKYLGNGSTDNYSTTNNYFKVQDGLVYCNAPIDLNENGEENHMVVLWSVEEVAFSAAAAAYNSTIFDDETTTLSVTTVAGSGNYTYSWSPANGLSDATSANPTFTPTATGEHTFTCTVTDTESGSTAEASVTVYVNARPALQLTVSADKELIYNDGETAVLTATVTEGTGYAPYTYSWTLNGEAIEGATEATYTFSNTTVGEYTLACTVTDSRSNIVTDSKTITVKDLSEKPLVIELGTESTNTHGFLPTYTYYNYSLTQQIYTQSEINMSNNVVITSIAFKESAGVETTRNFSIYMQNTSETTCNTSSFIIQDKACFEGNVTFKPYEWVEITLETPFEYDATKNILLCVDDNTGSYINFRSFATYNTTTENSNYIYNDNTNYDPLTSSYGCYTVGQKNSIKLGYEIPAPKPENLVATPAQIHVGETTTLTWNELEGAVSYNIYVDGVLNGNTEKLTYELSDLTYNVEPGHTIEVAAVYADATESGKASVTVQVAGTFTLTVNVTDGTNPIEGATVNIDMAYAYDEFKNQISPVTVEPTGTDGKTTVELLRLPNEGFYNDNGNWVYPFYTVEVSKSPYQKQEDYINPGYVVTNGYTMDFVLALPKVLYIRVQDEEGEYLYGGVMEGTNVVLSWDAVEGADAYKVSKLVDGEVESSETITETTYTIEGVWKGDQYAVSALFGELESEKTEADLQVKGNGYFKGYVTDGTNALQGIQVKVSSEYGDASAVATTDAEGYFNGKIVEGDNYILTISHSDYEEFTSETFTIGYEAEYDFETITLTAKPSASDITGVTATLNGENVDVEWTVNETSTYTKYNVYRRLAGTQGKGDNIAQNVEATSTTDTKWETLEPGTYQYGVAALVEPQAQTRGTEVIFEEGFENTNTETMLPDGWTKYKDNSSASSTPEWKASKQGLTTKSTPKNGEYSLYSRGACPSTEYYYCVTPLLDFEVKTLSFYYVNPNWGTYSVLDVCYSEYPNGPWESVFNSKDQSEWTYVELDLSNKGLKQIYVAFKNSDNYGYGIGIDDVRIVGESISSEVETQIVWSNEVEKQGPNTFEGTVSTDWNVPGNWSHGNVPATGDEVIVNAEAVISGNVELSALDIVGNGSVTVDANASLTVTGAITQEKDYSLIMNDGAQVFQNNANVTAQFNMNLVNPSDWSTSNKDGWQFISSPLSNVSVTNIAEGNYDLYKYDGDAESELEWLNHKDANFADATYQHHIGYLASHQTKTTLEFKGTLNYNDYYGSYAFYDFVEYYENEPLKNFYLIGNPYPFNISWADFKNNKGMVNGYAYVKEDGNYWYATSGEIAVGDGFFVQAISGTPDDQYSTLYYYLKGSGNTRSTKESNNSLNITATGNAGEDNVIINLAGKSEGFDKLQNFNDAIATVYVAEDGKNYGIYNCESDVQEIQLNFNANKMGNYTISIEPNGKFQTVTLVDRFTGIETNMLVEDYNFTAMSSDNHNRFIVRFANGQESTDNSHFVYQSGEELILNIQGEVQIVDVLGRVVYNGKAMNDINRINVSSFNSGAYMVKVMNGNEVKVEKVVIY